DTAETARGWDAPAPTAHGRGGPAQTARGSAPACSCASFRVGFAVAIVGLHVGSRDRRGYAPGRKPANETALDGWPRKQPFHFPGRAPQGRGRNLSPSPRVRTRWQPPPRLSAALTIRSKISSRRFASVIAHNPKEQG